MKNYRDKTYNNQNEFTINYLQIGKRIKQKRNEALLSQEDLADLLDSSPFYISRIETGRAKVSLLMLMKIAEALDVTVDELLTGAQIPTPYDYQTDIDHLLYDCSVTEKSILFDVLCATKKSLRENERINSSY